MLECSRDALDIAGSKGPVSRHQVPFNDCGMRDDAAAHGEHMKPAHRVVPVVIAEAALEGLIQQFTERMPLGLGKLVRCEDPDIDHSSTLSRDGRACVSSL
jgi:hypothetical protein